MGLDLGALQRQLAAEFNQAPGLFGEIARMEGLLADTYRDRVSYELLQNSDDAGSRLVEITRLSAGRYRWRNDGRPLDTADVEALCRSASSTKHRGGGTIGYRGIGFKSLAAVASKITVDSAGTTFEFDRDATAELLGAQASAVPLIRVPTGIRAGGREDGVVFDIDCAPGQDARLTALDPLSLLFLRHIERVVVHEGGRTRSVELQRDRGAVTLRDAEGEARFAMLHQGTAVVAVPVNPRALAMTGVAGRLACFLPLDDVVGLPVIVSGDLLTDPSRTHAVLGDASTQAVLREAAEAIADCLRTPDAVLFDVLWELLLDGEDPRGPLMSTAPTAAKILLTALREDMARKPPPFAYSPIPLDPADVTKLFPAGAPAALYEENRQPRARALKTVMGLKTVDFTARIAADNLPDLSDSSLKHLARHLADLTKMHGRKPSPAEQRIIDQADGTVVPKEAAPIVRTAEPVSRQESLGAVLARWRTAETATMEFLNGRGWNLTDVSRQNVGYDLEGTDATGSRVRVEVKKVDRLDARFAVTNNEMALMSATQDTYLLAIVVGDGRQASLMLLDPTRSDLPKERVCRRWDWEFTDWARFADAVP